MSHEPVTGFRVYKDSGFKKVSLEEHLHKYPGPPPIGYERIIFDRGRGMYILMAENGDLFELVPRLISKEEKNKKEKCPDCIFEETSVPGLIHTIKLCSKHEVYYKDIEE